MKLLLLSVCKICWIIMENIESSWNILMDINFKILQSKYFNYKFSTYIKYLLINH